MGSQCVRLTLLSTVYSGKTVPCGGTSMVLGHERFIFGPELLMPTVRGVEHCPTSTCMTSALASNQTGRTSLLFMCRFWQIPRTRSRSFVRHIGSSQLPQRDVLEPALFQNITLRK